MFITGNERNTVLDIMIIDEMHKCDRNIIKSQLC